MTRYTRPNIEQVAAKAFEHALGRGPVPEPPGGGLRPTYALAARSARALVRAYKDPTTRRALPDNGLMIELSKIPPRGPHDFPWMRGAWFVAQYEGEYLLGFAHNR